jgi:hypothetical protein
MSIDFFGGVANGDKPNCIHKGFLKMYGEATVYVSTCQQWVRWFKWLKQEAQHFTQNHGVVALALQ